MLPRPFEEIAFYWGQVVRAAPEGFERTFARSIARQLKRPNWVPSPKQERLMRRMVADLFEPKAEFELIERDWGGLHASA